MHLGLSLSSNKIEDADFLLSFLSTDLSKLIELGIVLSQNNITKIPDMKLTEKILPNLEYLTFIFDGNKITSLATLTAYLDHLTKVN